jgi:uncharacterized protein with GYD domain
MARFVVLINFTEKGISNIKGSPARASQFKAQAAQKGVTVEAIYWLLGEYDGLLVLSAPTEEAITALVLYLGTLGYVHTRTYRAYDEGEFSAIAGKL